MYPFIATVLNSEKYYNKMENLHKMDHMSFYAGCEITVGHRKCPTNLAQRPTEKRFFICLMAGQCPLKIYLLLNRKRVMKILFTDSHFLIENNNTTSLKTELFNRNLAFFLFLHKS